MKLLLYHAVAYRGGGLKPPPPKFRRPSKIVPNSTRLWKLLKIPEFRTPTPQDVRKKGTKILKLPEFAVVLHYLLTPWCRVLLEKLPGLQLVKKFPAFHGTRRFITALTSVRQLSLSWASPIQSIYPHPTSWRSILILFTHLRLGLLSGLFPSSFPTKTLYTPLSHPYAPHAQPISFHRLFIVYIYYTPLHVSSTIMLIFRRTNVISTASGIVTVFRWLYSTQVTTVLS